MAFSVLVLANKFNDVFILNPWGVKGKDVKMAYNITVLKHPFLHFKTTVEVALKHFLIFKIVIFNGLFEIGLEISF